MVSVSPPAARGDYHVDWQSTFTALQPATLDRTPPQPQAPGGYAGLSVRFAENFDSYTWFENYLPRLEAVTIQDVRDVGERYLRPQNRTVGWLIPTGGGDDGDYEEDEE